MHGFKRKKHANGGLIKGPGTGTSDEIDLLMEQGSYVMPADSTTAIGAENLQQMGTPTPVSVSNGEYQLPPEQVHAIGVQTLDALRGQTHEPVGGFKPQQFFADGGLIEDPRKRRPLTIPTVAVRAADGSTVYVDSQGRATAATPPPGLGQVPQGPATTAMPRTGAAMVQPQVAPQFQAPPTGPAITGRPGAAAPGVSAMGFQPRARTNPVNRDWQTRAEGLARAKADTAAYERARAAQDVRFAQAANPRGTVPTVARGIQRIAESPAMRRAGIVGAGLSAVPEVAQTTEVALDPNSTRLDAATQGAEGVARFAGTGAGAGIGAKVGGALGAFGGPLAPFTIPGGAVVGGFLGGIAGNRLSDAAIRAGRALAGVDPESPITRIRADQDKALERMGAPETLYEPEPDPAVLANNITRVGNSFSGTNIGPGYTVNGSPSSETDPLVYHDENPSLAGAQNQLAKRNLFARTPNGIPGAPGGVVTAGGQQIAGGFQPASTRSGGPRAQLIRNSGTPSNAEILRERMRGQRQQLATQARGVDGELELRRDELGFRQGLEGARLAAEQAARGSTVRGEQRLERLRQQYEQSESDAERASIAQQLRDLTGEARPQYQVATAEELIDPANPLAGTRKTAYVIDPATGQGRPVNATASAALPPIHQNPAVLSIMNDTSLSREERARRIRALGYN